MRNLYLDAALLPDGWAERVLLRCDARGRIASVTSDVPCPTDAERLAGVALPGIPNLHSHAHQRAIAGLAERAGPDAADCFWTWRDAMYRALAGIGPDELEAIATQLYVEMLRAGYTTVAEFHYLHHDHDGRRFADPAEMSHRLVAAARRAGIRLVLLPVLYAASGFDGGPPLAGQRRFALDADGYAGLLQALRQAYGDAADVTLGVAPHSLRAVPPPLLQEAVALAGEAPIHLHIAEQVREVEECRAHTGVRPVAWLLDRFAVGPRWCLVHATHMEAAETVALAETGAVAGLCPTTEANLGDGIFPAASFRAAGGRFGIGSDSHISVSPVEELRWLEYAQRLVLRRRAVLANGPDRPTGRSLVEAAIAGGAQACGFAASGLVPGAPADLLVLDPADPLLAGRRGDALLDAFVFAGNRPLVRQVVVGGRVVVRDGHHPNESAAAADFMATLARIA
ncbi:MAG TPA: formimidoylglutamate deiminase [Acetobacteraceae bacterium]|nr:formimidoylglutamate deiminase [Acetobacteraceae bacterium]